MIELLAVWSFAISVHMPSTCRTDACRAARGPIEVRVTAIDEESCNAAKRIAMQMAGGEQNIDGIVVGCAARPATPAVVAPLPAEEPEL